MNNDIFKKMKVKPKMSAIILYHPDNYPNYNEFENTDDNKKDFVHLFVNSTEEFNDRFKNTTNYLKEDSLFWISYPKSSTKQKYDINRDSLWDLVIPYGFHPVAQISLNDNWSAIRLKPNEDNVIYERPSIKKVDK